MKSLKLYYQEKPLTVILIAAFIVRMASVIFSKGFGWIDDQFLIVEIAQSWVDGSDYYNWLPDSKDNNGPVKFSFFYTGIIYYILSFLETIGITNPQGKMYFIRFVHAIWSLLIIKFGYQISIILANKKSAKTIGWMLALLWLFPFLSVRTLVEFVSIPLVLWSILIIIDDKRNTKLLYWLVAGILLGLAFNIRLQTALLTGGIGLVILLQKKYLKLLFLSLGFALMVLIFQGAVDYYFWGYPFAQLIEYVGYNMVSASAYIVGPWYMYITFILLVLLPPFSLAMIAGFAYSWKKLAIIFVPVLLFLIFHSYYPNKQERFVTTILPFIIISGVIGWNSLLIKLNSLRWNKINHYFLLAFWIINSIALIPVSVIYSKKARVESMTYLSQYSNIDYFVIEDMKRNVLRFPPMFYLEKWVDYDAIMQGDNIKSFSKKKKWDINANQPDFVLFFQPDDIDNRVKKMKEVLPGLVYETTIEPGNADRVLHWLNPINANENIYIYRNKLSVN